MHQYKPSHTPRERVRACARALTNIPARTRARTYGCNPLPLSCAPYLKKLKNQKQLRHVSKVIIDNNNRLSKHSTGFLEPAHMFVLDLSRVVFLYLMTCDIEEMMRVGLFECISQNGQLHTFM